MRIAAALSRLVATPCAADVAAADPAAPPTLQSALDAAAAPREGSAAADDSPANVQQLPAPAGKSSADVMDSNDAAAAGDVTAEAEVSQPVDPAAAQTADLDVLGVEAAAAAAPEPATTNAVVSASSAADSEQASACAPEQWPAEVPEPSPLREDDAAQQANIAAPAPGIPAAEQPAAGAAECPTPAAVQVDAAVQAASPAAEATALELPAGAASPAGDVAMSGGAGGDDGVAASPAGGDQLPYTTPMNVISNPLYASNQRT